LYGLGGSERVAKPFLFGGFMNMSKDEFLEYLKSFDIVPLYEDFPCDMDTAISVYLKLKDKGACYLLESVEKSKRWGRYSFIGFDRLETFSFSIGEDEKPLSLLKEKYFSKKVFKIKDLPRFFGGGVGYVGYDCASLWNKVTLPTKDIYSLPDISLLFTKTVIIIDDFSKTFRIVYNAEHPSDYEEAQKTIDKITSLLHHPFSYDEKAGKSSLIYILNKEKYKEIVRKAKKYIENGEIIQSVLAHHIVCSTDISPFDIYRALRRSNPSPYMFYIDFDSFKLIGSSPEVLVRLEGENIEISPIAGTRRRGKNMKEDKKLEEELLQDEKEKAEHLMLVDLARNDVGRVAKTRTVKVENFMYIEKFSQVMHIVSDIKAKIEKDKDMFDLFKSCFPAGTVSGAPKVRAMQIIADLEKTRRGPYAGSVGYFGYDGNMDMCITIRTIVWKENKAFVGVGAGIVYDSIPQMEYAETMGKASACINALGKKNDINDR